MCRVKSMWELRWSSSSQSRWLLRREAMAASRKKAAFSAVGARSSLWFWSCRLRQGRNDLETSIQVDATRQLPSVNARCRYIGFRQNRKGEGAQWNETLLTPAVTTPRPPGAPWLNLGFWGFLLGVPLVEVVTNKPQQLKAVLWASQMLKFVPSISQNFKPFMLINYSLYSLFLLLFFFFPLIAGSGNPRVLLIVRSEKKELWKTHQSQTRQSVETGGGRTTCYPSESFRREQSTDKSGK